MSEQKPHYDGQRALYEPSNLAVIRSAEPPLSDAVVLAMAAQNLASLSPAQQVEAIRAICAAINVPAALSPIMLLPTDDRLVPYVTAAGTNNVRDRRGISIVIGDRRELDGIYFVTARATTPDGRTDESTGAVPLVKQDGEWKTTDSGKKYFSPNGKFLPLAPADRANAIMKAETKAKRRVTLSIAGIGFMDESEIDQVRGAGRGISVEIVDQETGEIIDVPSHAPVPAIAGERPTDAGLELPAVTYAEAITAASNMDTLVGIGKQMSGAGYTDRDVWAAFNRKKLALAKETRAKQAADPQPALDLPRAPLS